MILEGVHQGMGKHNDAIKDDDAKVAALMVSSVNRLRNISNKKSVASNCNNHIHRRYDVHQTKHRRLPPAPFRKEGLQLHYLDQSHHHHPLHAGSFPLGCLPV